MTANIGDAIVWNGDEWINVGPFGVGPSGPPGTAGPAGPAGTNGTNGVGVPTGGTAGQSLTKVDGTDYNTQWSTVSGGGGSLTDGDKGDIVVSASGATWLFDTGVVTAAAKTVLDDTTVAAMRTTLGLGSVDNTADTAKPVFTSSVNGLAPASGGGSTTFLRADGTWTTGPVGATGATGSTGATGPQGPSGGSFAGHASFTYNTTITAPPVANQLRMNSATLSAVTTIWVFDQDLDGLDISLGMDRIKAGWQLYIQDYDDSTKWVKYNVTANTVDAGTYHTVTVSYLSAGGAIIAGRVELQGIAPAQVGIPSGGTTGQGLTKVSGTDYAVNWTSVQPLDTDLTTIAGLTATTDNVIQSVSSAWASRTPAQLKTSMAFVKGDVGLGNVDNTSDATKDAATATLTNKTLTDAKVNLAVNAQTGTTYTLVLTDASKLVTCSNASAVTVTVPPNSTVAFPTGTQITIIGIGVGIVTVAQGAGVTVNSTPSLAFRARYSAATLVKTGTDQWYLMGDLA